MLLEERGIGATYIVAGREGEALEVENASEGKKN